MCSEEKYLRFFMGANTSQGFVSRYDQLASVEDDWRLFTIKGGPGCGKSTMMRKIIDHLKHIDNRLEIIHCSSDHESIDALRSSKLKISVADATSPHVIEPKFPGAFEITVDLSSCWEDEKLFLNREKIIELFKNVSACHKNACRYLCAASSLQSDTYRISLKCMNTEKILAYTKRLCEKEFKKQGSGSGKESVRFLSAVTDGSVKKHEESINLLAQKVYLLNDEYGAVSRAILNEVKTSAIQKGYDIIACYCVLGPYEKIEHIFVPELGLAFVTSNKFHDFSYSVDPYRIINVARFSFNEELKKSKKRLYSNRKAVDLMINEAEKLIKEAKKLHDELEEYYVKAMDFTKAEKLTREVLSKIDKIIEK